MPEINTLTGLSLAQAITALDAELPAAAYKSVPGGADLTDIDPNQMRKVLNEVFGLCGCGWGYTYNPDTVYTRAEVQVTARGKERSIVVATVKYLEVWYRLVVDGETIQSAPIPGTGSSENSNDAYALKGALTNAIGNAVSNIGFQMSVYLGKRSHKTVNRKRQPPQRQPVAPEAPGTNPTPKLSPVPVNEDIEDLDDLDISVAEAPAPSGNGNYGSYMIPIGKKTGQKLADISRKALEWYAHDLVPTTNEARTLQQKALAYLEALATV